MAWYRPWDKSGNVAKERRRNEQAERTMWEQRTADPYGENPPQWDEAGFPVGPMPRGKYALDYQYEANRRAEQHRRVLWGDAQNSMKQGLDLFQTYRPGGSAAAASGMFGQKAGLYATQALNTSAPDLLIDWREQIRARAEEKADTMNRNSQLITGLSAFNILGGTAAPLAGPGPAQPGPQNSQAAGGTYGAMAGGNQGALPGGGGGVGAGDSGMAGGMAAGIQAGGQAGVLPGLLAPEQGLGSTQGPLGGGAYGGGAGGSAGATSISPGGGGSGSKVSPRAGGATDERGGGMAGSAVAGGGGLGDYSGPAVADRGLVGAPTAADMTVSVWADDPYREQGDAVMASSARKTLLEALALG